MNLDGIHHVAAITADGSDCDDFYGLLLGLDRIPRRTGGRALVFGDASGTPGSVISFDEVPGAPAGRLGPGLVHRILWRVEGPSALDFWQRRLELAGIGVDEVLRGGDIALRFSDPEGLAHELVVDDGSGPALTATATAIPAEHRIRGLAGARACVRGSVESSDLLAGRLGFQGVGAGEWLIDGAGGRARYSCDPAPAERPVQGTGTVTYVAWSCRPGDERAWRQRVIGMGATVSGIVDVDRCRCFFFREPDGVLFAVATRDGAPGAASFPRSSVTSEAA